MGKKALRYLYIITLSSLLTVTSFAKPTSQIVKPGQNTPVNWYDNLIFQNENFSFELLRPLGAAHYGGSDIGEVLQTVKKNKA